MNRLIREYWIDDLTLTRDWRVWRECSPNVRAAQAGLIAETKEWLLKEPGFWIRVARLQWLDGCLPPDLRDRALAFADAGPVLDDNFPEDMRAATAEFYRRCARQLRRPQRPARPFGVRAFLPCPAMPGDAVVAQLLRGGPVILLVKGQVRDGARYLPRCEAFPWDPGVEDLQHAVDGCRKLVKSSFSTRPTTVYHLWRNGFACQIERVFTLRTKGSPGRTLVVASNLGRGIEYAFARHESFAPRSSVARYTVTQPAGVTLEFIRANPGRRAKGRKKSG